MTDEMQKIFAILQVFGGIFLSFLFALVSFSVIGLFQGLGGIEASIVGGPIADIYMTYSKEVPFLLANALLYFWLRWKAPFFARGILIGFLFFFLFLGFSLDTGIKNRDSFNTMQQGVKSAQLGDMGGCESMKVTDALSEAERANCIAGVAQARKDPSCCARIPPATMNDWSKRSVRWTTQDCYDDLATTLQDPTLCKYVFYMPEQCVEIAQKWKPQSGKKLTFADIGTVFPLRYSNPGVHLQFGIPHGWKKIQDQWGILKSGTIVGELDLADLNEPKATITITSSSYMVPSSTHTPTSLKEEIDTGLENAKKLIPGFVVEQVKEMTVNGQKGYLIETRDTADGDTRNRHWDNGIHSIVMSAPVSVWSKYEDVFNSALQSYQYLP